MLRNTIDWLACPKRKGKQSCGSGLSLLTEETSLEVRQGELVCKECKSSFPILNGVAILVNDVREYLLMHVKGISKHVDSRYIPKKYRSEYLAYQKEIEEEHIEEDLESDRVNALYLMNHYLKANQVVTQTDDPLLKKLIEQYWDQGPFQVVEAWVPKTASILELGCGVGGLGRRFIDRGQAYLGVDSSFQSILIARHLNLGSEFQGDLKTPKDLFLGGLTEKFQDPHTNKKEVTNGRADFIVGEIDSLPLQRGMWDYSIALNAIDMLETPSTLPEFQFQSLKAQGVAIQSAPYIWHERVTEKLRKEVPKEFHSSSSAVEWIYKKVGFEILEAQDFIPWLFFKHGRQLELYSVHAFQAKKI